MKRLVMLGFVVLAVGAFTSARAEENATSKTLGPAQSPGRGMASLAEASAARKYLFAFFYKEEDANTVALRKVFDETMARVADQANTVAIGVGDPAEKQIVAKYGVARAPMPLVIAVAPKGAVTGSIASKFTGVQLIDMFGTPAMEACLQHLQQRKLVFLCVQNGTTKSNEAALKGVQDFKADKRFAQFTEIVKIDPASAAEGKFLSRLQIEPTIDEAVTVFLAPPNVALAKYKGAVTSDALVKTLASAKSGGCGPGASGCGPGASGCGPTASGPAK